MKNTFICFAMIIMMMLATPVKTQQYQMPPKIKKLINDYTLQELQIGLVLKLSTLNGCSIFSSEAKPVFLGIIANSTVTNSIFNSYGTYGSKYSSNSIWNSYSSYGSKYGNTSAFNDMATSPPMIICKESVVGYLTTNQTKSGAVNPNLLMFAFDN
jgi:hypothetical protein